MTRLTRQGTRLRSPRLAAALAILAVPLVLPLVLAPRSEAFIYWTTGPPAKIVRANLDGTGVDPSFITGTRLSSGAGDLAVGAEHIYWTHNVYDDETGAFTGMAIGRARLDGTHVDPGIVRAAGPTGSFTGDLAVGANHLYWTNTILDCDTCGGHGTIGRANLDGSDVDQFFIPNISRLGYVAVDAAHVYWTNFDTATIGRANLDGSDVDQSFITGIDVPGGIAVDADHVYWTGIVCSGFATCEPRGPAIGRADLDGTNVDRRFITGDAGLHASGWWNVAVDANFVYWTADFFTIDRANLDGTGVGTLIPASELSDDCVEACLGGFAVDALADTKLAGRATAAKTQQQGKKIVVKVKVKAKEPLTAKASGKIKVNPTYKLKSRKAQLTAGQTKTLKLRPTNNGQAKRIAGALERGKKATARLTVRLTDQVNSETEKLSVRLKRAQPR